MVPRLSWYRVCMGWIDNHKTCWFLWHLWFSDTSRISWPWYLRMLHLTKVRKFLSLIQIDGQSFCWSALALGGAVLDFFIRGQVACREPGPINRFRTPYQRFHLLFLHDLSDLKEDLHTCSITDATCNWLEGLEKLVANLYPNLVGLLALEGFSVSKSSS